MSKNKLCPYCYRFEDIQNDLASYTVAYVTKIMDLRQLKVLADSIMFHMTKAIGLQPFKEIVTAIVGCMSNV